MKNQLHRFFVFFIGALFVFIVLFSLFGPQGKKIDLKEVSFSTNNSSTLFFKNMRSYFYDKEERTDAKFDLFRIGSREKDSLQNKISFVLIHNWLMNECYIRAESKFKVFTIQWRHEEKSGIIALEGDNSYAHYIFAAQLFEQLDRKASVMLEAEVGTITLSEEESSSLKTTLKDYFKLVGKLR